jgi:hypothetical protein
MLSSMGTAFRGFMTIGGEGPRAILGWKWQVETGPRGWWRAQPSGPVLASGAGEPERG